MKISSSIKLGILIVSIGSGLLAGASAQAADYSVTQACQRSEVWSLTQKENAADAAAPNWLKQFQSSVTGAASPIYAFSQAVQLKKLSAILNHADFEHDFSEYWVGRILYTLKLDPLSHQVFESIYQHSENAQIKKAAFLCMAEIQKRSPDWNTPSDLRWVKLPFDQNDAESVFLSSLNSSSNPPAILADGYRDFIIGKNATLDRHYPEAIEHLQKYLTFTTTHSSEFLNRYQDDAHLFLGRSLYALGKFTESSAEFQKVKKTSNQQIDALNDVVWPYLLSNHYDEAIGISMQLRTGALKHTFSPEPMMVAAMALNELCLYQDSIRMVEAFVHDYGPSYNWLSSHQAHTDLYGEVLKALKKQTDVPVKITTEWMKSPAFLSRQMELNQLIEHPKKLVDIQKNGINEQTRLTQAFIDHVQSFSKAIKIAKLKLKPGEELAPTFGTEFISLKRELRNLSRFYKASKIWKNLAKNFEKKIPQFRSALVSKINHDLAERNKQLLVSLNKVRDNTDLIEVEIYNGASQDMIWKNAHPDYDKVSATLEDQKEKADAARVWNWGHFVTSDIENAEVWEDEMGALKADISDQCSKQERYSQLKLTKRNSK